MEKQPLLTRDGKLILVSVFANSIPLGYMNVVPLVYLLKIGFSPVTIGTIYAASGIANTVGYTPFGVLADRYGRKKFLIIGSLLPSLSYCIFGLTVDPYMLTVASVIGGVGIAGGLAVAISSPSLLPLLAESTSEKHRTTIFAILEGIATLALSIGSFSSFLPGLIARTFSQGEGLAHSESYLFMSGLMAISVIPLLALGKGGKSILALDVPAPSPQDSPSLRRFEMGQQVQRVLPVTSWLKIAKFSLIFGLLGLGFGVLIQLLPTWYSLRFAVSESTVGLWTGFAQIVSLIAIPLIPALVRSRGAVIASAGAGIAACIPLLVMPLSGSFEIAASLYVARSVLSSLSVVILQSYIVGAVSERERATTIGIAFTAWGLANSGATVVAGQLLGTGLLIAPFVLGTAAYLGSSMTFLLFFLSKHGCGVGSEDRERTKSLSLDR